MSNKFSINFDWLSREHGTDIERVTLAELSINVNSIIATELYAVYDKTTRQSVRASAYDMALWYASNWWRLLWEPERNTLSWKMSHKLSSIGGGYLWPNISFISDGRTVHIHSGITSGINTRSVRYLNSFDIPIERQDFEQEIENFINIVITRLSDTIGKSDLTLLWNEVLEERRDTDQSKWRRLEAIMGYDPDEASDTFMKELQEAATLYGLGAVEEMAASSRTQALDHINLLWNETKLNATSLRVQNTENLRASINNEMNPSLKAWEQAERAAKILRDHWSLADGPISNEDLSERLSLPKATITNPDKHNAFMHVGFRNGDSDSIKVALKGSRASNRRFALSRLIGDHLLISSKKEKLLPATNSSTYRQKFQRAFAQELLCPYDELNKYLDNSPLNDDTFEEAAEYFLVSPMTIQSTLANKGRLNHI